MRKATLSRTLGLAIVLFLVCTAYDGGAAEPQLKLRLQTNLIPVQTKRTVAPFSDEVAATSKGTIEISLFSVGAVVPMKEMLDAVGSGALDMAFYAEGTWYNTVPVSEIAMGIPFAFKDIEEAKTYMFEKGFLDLLREGYAKQNVYVIPFEPYPVGLMTKKPVKTVGDIKGMKIRAYGTMAGFLGKLGASTIQIPGGELYTALATGVVAGAHWADAGPMYEMKFHEVLKNYMHPDPIQCSWNCIMINMNLWKKLTPEQRKLIETSARNAGDAGFKSSRALTKTALEDMTQKWKVEVIRLPEADLRKMENTSLEFQDEIAKKDPLCAKAIAKLKELRGAKAK